MTKRNILWVINPHAGEGDQDWVFRMLEQKDQKNVYKTTGDNDQQAIEAMINDLSPELVVTGGGDGTIKLVATLLIGKSTPIGILPLGSANGLATELNISMDIERLILAYIYDDYELSQLDGILINDEHYCFHISDIGLNARIVKGFEQQSVRGFLGYGLSAISQLNVDDLVFEVEIDGKTIETMMVFFANARKYGTGVVINPGGKLSDGQFEVGVLKEVNTRLIGQLLFETETNPDPEALEIHSVKKIDITTKKPVELQVDGEYIGKITSLKAEIIPDKINLAYCC
jgi:diacylglycerol kinase family enzyme